MQAAFDLVVRTAGGAVQSLQVTAGDATAARARAAQDGLQVLACTPRSKGDGRAARAASGSARGLDVATFSHELASLLAAGLSVIEALRALAAKEAHGAQRAVLLEVVKSVSEGQPLSAALDRQSERFPPLLIATVRASEQTGDLSTSLLRYAQHQQSIKALRDKVVGAAIYPMLLLAVGFLVVMFLLGVVVPKFSMLIESTRRELPWTSQLLMGWGRMVAGHSWAVAAVALAAITAVVVTARQALRTGAKSRWIESLPLVGPLIRQFRHAQMYRTAGMLVKGGIATPKALQLSTNLLGEADRTRLTRAVTLIHEGRSISSALQAAELADPVAASMLAVAERTGALAEILERIASFHESRLQRSVELTSRLFEPLLMIVIGLVIGAIVVLMYLPIFDLASSLQ
ncbi:MAG: type II secretion system F family protein [Aquincola sp.]|nr:type II secretion system F family protein [Aquincola sp.]